MRVFMYFLHLVPPITSYFILTSPSPPPPPCAPQHAFQIDALILKDLLRKYLPNIKAFMDVSCVLSTRSQKAVLIQECKSFIVPIECVCVVWFYFTEQESLCKHVAIGHLSSVQ